MVKTFSWAVEDAVAQERGVVIGTKPALTNMTRLRACTPRASLRSSGAATGTVGSNSRRLASGAGCRRRCRGGCRGHACDHHWVDNCSTIGPAPGAGRGVDAAIGGPADQANRGGLCVGKVAAVTASCALRAREPAIASTG